MSALLRPRWIYAAIFLSCAGLMAFGLYLQHVERLEPCPLCILQRYAFVVTGSIALVAAIHGAGRIGTWIYSALVSLSAIAGAALAARQTWLQHNPPNALDCGPDLAYMLESMPFAQVLPKVFKGEGDCAKVVWQFLGLSIPEWALVWFVLFVIVAALCPALSRRPRRANRVT
ncbi:MAG TPA: disulfide bond formation protein B [Burkholderiales bacterium]|nr:disulfide bond formation protein B [Burkholderiales bacterium]